MELQSRRDNAGEAEGLDRIDQPVLAGHQSVYPYFVQQESPLLHYWRILTKRRWTVAATLGIIFILSVIATLNATRLYQATSNVAIFPETPNVLGFNGLEDSSPDFQYDVALETQAAILRSDALGMKVIEALRLDQNPRFTGTPRSQA